MSERNGPEIERRRLLTRVGVAGTAALAGCSNEEPATSDARTDGEPSGEKGTKRNGNGDGPENERTTLRLLHDTHIHGRLGNSGEPHNVANYFGLIEELYAAADHAVAVGNGDDLHMSVESSVFDGNHVTTILNESPVSYNTIGNHEFDNGPESLRENIAASEFTWVSANVLESDAEAVFGSDEGAVRYATEEIGGVRVGFTGFAPENTPDVTSVDGAAEVLEPVGAAEAVVADLEADGADVIVVLSHLASSVAEELVAAVDGIDVVVGDHTASVVDEPVEVNETLLSYVGDEFDYVGQLDLEIAIESEGESGAIEEYAFERHDLAALVDDSAVDPHEGVRELLVDYEARLDEELGEVIGETTVDLDVRAETVRREESNFGTWLADVIRDDVDADVAIQNGGGIRSDRLYEAGELSRGTVVDILPFPNRTVKLEVSGETLEGAIEHGVSAVADGHGRFPQVSGLSFAYDPDAEAGRRVEELRVGENSVDSDATYELGTNDFLAGGGDGYDELEESAVLVPPDEGTVLSALAMATIETNGTISPIIEGRIETV
ncbi:bifunctional metallophosphatase/5'-nucleotidase [Natrialba asiatica]|uniref:5'-nucleotidase n=1 Tax=Natrialba asiatica (strain ATCC 700177 / DSM 12278 / JCM 9576 / FERM P-10747 / NBRC 102637 / 172P1) TaxID=29540 RepID=M0AIY4_NATA1|nr:5'-nucleotidase C-terminal domain-containing protein [Natrialba asiatica]ELY98479.1 5'-nucleotidase [Natrialba asiatica DSM 12278]